MRLAPLLHSGAGKCKPSKDWKERFLLLCGGQRQPSLHCCSITGSITCSLTLQCHLWTAAIGHERKHLASSFAPQMFPRRQLLEAALRPAPAGALPGCGPRGFPALVGLAWSGRNSLSKYRRAQRPLPGPWAHPPHRSLSGKVRVCWLGPGQPLAAESHHAESRAQGLCSSHVCARSHTSPAQTRTRLGFPAWPQAALSLRTCRGQLAMPACSLPRALL